MTVETAWIPYADAIVRALWDYFGMSGYVKLQYKKHREGLKQYDSMEQLWGDVRNTKDLDNGRVIKLVDFNFTEWFPWMPGMYWTDYGRELRSLAQEHKIVQVLDENTQTQVTPGLLDPMGKTLTVLSGVGGVRMGELERKSWGIFNKPIKVLGATSSENRPNVSGGVPIVMSENAYREIKRELENRGVIKATVEGIYTSIPETLGEVWVRRPEKIPNFCIYIESGRTITKTAEKADDVITAGWSIFEEKDTRAYSMAFTTFAVADERGPVEAGNFLMEYIVNRYKGRPLTDFDEKTHTLEALYPVSRVKDGDFDIRRLQDLKLKIYQRYPSRPNNS
jgi:hypothetical protein